MPSTESVIELYKKASQKNDTDTPLPVIKEDLNNISALSSEERFESFIVVLGETLKKQQKIKEKELKISNESSNILDKKQNNNEPFESFITTLVDTLKQEIPKNATNDLVDVSQPQEKEKKPKKQLKEKNFVEHYTKELAKDKKNEIVQTDEEIKIKSLVSKQVNEEINRNKQVFPNLNIGESGGGTNAVQYANGGTMNGDLNVLGKYLSGGVELSDIFKNSTGFVDRLISNSQTLLLSSDGSLIFQNENNNIVLTTSTDYKWIFDDQGVLTTPQDYLITKNFSTTGLLLSSGINLNEIFLPKDELIFDGGQY